MKSFVKENWWIGLGLVTLLIFGYFWRQEQIADFAAKGGVPVAQVFQPAPAPVAAPTPNPSPSIAFQAVQWVGMILAGLILLGIVLATLVWLVTTLIVIMRARQARLRVATATAAAQPMVEVIRSQPTQTSALRRTPSRALPASQPAPRLSVEVANVEPVPEPSITPAPEPWTVLAAPDVAKWIERLGVTPTPETLVANRWKRIVDLQASLGAHAVRHAPDYSVALFSGIKCGQDQLDKKCAPQPAKIIFENGSFVAVVALVQQAAIVPVAAPVAEPAPPAAPPAPVPTAPAIPSLKDQWAAIPHPAFIAQELPLPIELFLSLVFVILGKRRTGKSYTLGVVMENLCRYRFPFALIDMEGEAWSLRAKWPVIIAGKSDTTTVDVEVAPGQAAQLAAWAHTNGAQLILDISDYSLDEQIEFAANFATGLWDTAKTAQPKRRFAFVVDEAHELYPARGKTAASDMINRIILRGGKHGLTFGAATQSPANLNINARKQADLALLHRVDQKRDLDAYGDVLPAEWTDGRIQTAMTDLTRGQVLAKVSMSNQPTTVKKVQIRQRTTPHLGSSPGMEEQPLPTIERVALKAGVIDAIKAALANEPALQVALPSTQTVQDTPIQLLKQSSLKELRNHPAVIEAVKAVYESLPAHERNVREITNRVFESTPGKRDGWSGSRWKEVIQPIMTDLGLASRSAQQETAEVFSAPTNVVKAA